MKRIYSAKDPLMIGHLGNVLTTFGIRCQTRNLDLWSAAGELPLIDCWPELWIAHDDDFERARAILRKTLAPLKAVRKSWHCRHCDEEVDGQFSECWNCQEEATGNRQ